MPPLGVTYKEQRQSRRGFPQVNRKSKAFQHIDRLSLKKLTLQKPSNSASTVVGHAGGGSRGDAFFDGGFINCHAL